MNDTITRDVALVEHPSDEILRLADALAGMESAYQALHNARDELSNELARLLVRDGVIDAPTDESHPRADVCLPRGLVVKLSAMELVSRWDDNRELAGVVHGVERRG